jgi:hypothetical protein
MGKEPTGHTSELSASGEIARTLQGYSYPLVLAHRARYSPGMVLIETHDEEGHKRELGSGFVVASLLGMVLQSRITTSSHEQFLRAEHGSHSQTSATPGIVHWHG